MTLPDPLAVALKEWAAICHALEHGRQMILLRKGGIHDERGRFKPEHEHFLLFPTYLHQGPEMLKPSEHAEFEERSEEPQQVRISLAATVTDVFELSSRQQAETIKDEHVWTPQFIDMRFSYRPKVPLYLLLLRVYALEDWVTIQNTPAYAGCKSWVPLEQPISTAGAEPVLPERVFQVRRQSLIDRLSTASIESAAESDKNA
jgi:hypothetical protein